MKPLAAWNTYRVGLGGGVALLVFALLVAYLSAASIGKSHYSGFFEHTAGLRVSEDVQVAGVSVGKVTGIKLDGRKVKVDFTVDHTIDLGERTTATVKVATLLGTHFLEVVPKGSGSLTKTLPLSQTSVPFNLQDVVENAGSSLKKYDSAKLSQSFTVMADALRGTPESTRKALIGVSQLSEVAAKRSDQMRRLLASTRTVTGKLSQDRNQIIRLLKESNLVLTELITRRDVIHRTLIDSQALAKAISGIIDDNDKEFGPLMSNLTTTLAVLRKHDAGLQKTIDGLATTSRFFANAIGTGPFMDLHLPVIMPDNMACLNPVGASCK